MQTPPENTSPTTAPDDWPDRGPDARDASDDVALLAALPEQIRNWATDLGFTAAGITATDLSDDERRLSDWLARGYHGEMTYMAAHGTRRSRPDELLPGTLRVISLRMPYLRAPVSEARRALTNREAAYVSRYALGRDYHKLMRNRLGKLAQRIIEAAGGRCRAFVDSAPVLEKALARNAGLGHFGKNSLLMTREAGSMFFLGEIYTDLALPIDPTPPVDDLCGNCNACINACPTDAILPDRTIDARRCVSYLTIEQRGPIPLELREKIGNRIFGCDDCQLVCPWNRDAPLTAEPDFAPRHGLDAAALVDLFDWDEATWQNRTAGMPLRRAGYMGWKRNIAIALGNAPTSATVVKALQRRLDDASEVVRDAVDWALSRHA